MLAEEKALVFSTKTTFYKVFFLLLHLFIYVFMCLHVGVKGQLARVSSFFPSCGSWGSNLGQTTQASGMLLYLKPQNNS